jgi:hypothetical protein
MCLKSELAATGEWKSKKSTYIIQLQLGFIQVILPRRKSGEAFNFCSLTAGTAMEVEYA